jgi:hypothetical protein
VHRHCDGTDPYLLRELRPGEQPSESTFLGMTPCDCGRTFDDVQRMTIYPHDRV